MGRVVTAAAFLCAAVSLAVAAGDSARRRNIASGDPYPDPSDLETAVRAEIRQYRQAKIFRSQATERFRERAPAGTGPAGPGNADTNSRSAATTGLGDPGRTTINAPNSIVARLGEDGTPTTVTLTVTIEGSTGQKGDTDLKKTLAVLLANNGGVPATAVSVQLTHVSGSVDAAATGAKSPSLRRRRLLAATIKAEVVIDVAGEKAAQAAFLGIKTFVQNGDFTRTLHNLGYRELRVTGMEGGPKNGQKETVNMPAPAACNGLSCSTCAGTPNCAWCATSNKCFSGDRDPDKECVADDNKKSLFHHWIFNPTECSDWAPPATAFAYPVLVDPDHCYNGFKDADESGLDCGGGCKKACVRRTSGGSDHVSTRAWTAERYPSVAGALLGQPRFKEMKTPAVRIAGQNPVGQRNIIPGTVEVSSTEMGSGYIPAEYHSTSRMNGDADAGATVMITPTA